MLANGVRGHSEGPHEERVIPVNSIVIARYQEDLEWITEIPQDFEIFLYNKGDAIVDPAVIARANHIIDRPNVGRESETYLHHMLTHRRTDRDFTVFAQGDPFEHSPDFLRLLQNWRDWSDLQPFTCQWRSDRNIPPASLMEEHDRHLAGRPRVRPERFSLFTWGPIDFIDIGALQASVDYRFVHGDLPDGLNVAAHFLYMCGLTDLAEEASQHTIGNFAYGAIFACRNAIVAELPSRSIDIMLHLSKGHHVHGYILERLWLHFFGAAFEMPRLTTVTMREAWPDLARLKAA